MNRALVVATARVLSLLAAPAAAAAMITTTAAPSRQPPPPSEGSALESALRSLTVAAAGGGDAVALTERLRAAIERLRTADGRARERLRTIRDALLAAGATSEILDRQAAAEVAYQSRSAQLHALLESIVTASAAGRNSDPVTPGLADAMRAAGATESGRPILRAATLPYRRAAIPPRRPVVIPAIVPSYLSPGIAAAGNPDDLSGDEQAQLSVAILEQARALGYEPPRIFDFVRNEILTEWYAGAMKGAEATLLAGAGNDADQASLLIALLRASGVPARYVTGVIERSVEEIAAELMLGDAAQVPVALASAGVAHRPLVRGGRVAAVELDHMWVSALVPYSNYRGVPVDLSGKTWIPLAPAIKDYTGASPSGVLRAMTSGGAYDPQEFLARFLEQAGNGDPIAELRRDVEAYLAGHGTYDEQLGARAVLASHLGVLPSSLPFAVVAVTREAPTLDPAAVGRAHFTIRDGVAEDAPVILDHPVSLSLLVGERVTLSYLPATVEDHRTATLFGGLGRAPAYLVSLRPQIKIGGRLEVAGAGAVGMGSMHRVELRLQGPWGEETVAETVLAGTYQALTIGPPLVGAYPDPADDPTDTEGLAARLLSRVARGYVASWDSAEAELAALAGIVVLHPVPSVAIANNAISFETLLGLPDRMRWEGATLDAALRISEPLARSGEPAETIDWMRLAALQGSALEHLVFEREFQVDAVSADKGLAVARAAGVEVVQLDAGNVDAEIVALVHSEAILDEIANWVRLGYVVEVPRGEIARGAWRGSVWRADDPATGAGGYFLSGGLAGGATAEPPGNWVLAFVAAALQAAYSEEPNQDPRSAASIVKVADTDGQRGEVAALLPRKLEVLIRDAEGRPVMGAPVTFTVTGGGGRLQDESGEANSVTVATNALGFASARLRLGERTAPDSVFHFRHQGDEYQTRVGVNSVEAAVATSAGALLPEAAFAAFGYPASAAALRRTDTEQTLFEYAIPGT